MEERRLSSYHHDERIRVQVAAEHPITRGLREWEMIDETYVMRDAAPEARAGRAPLEAAATAA